MADESKEKKPEGGEKKPEGGGGEKNADLKMIIDAIKEAYPAANIPSEVSNWNELALVLKAQKGGEPDGDKPEPEAAPEEPATADGAGPPMLMSTLDRDPAKKNLAVKYRKEELADARARIDAALKGDGKAGRDPKVARKLLRQVDGFAAVEMSFHDGEPKSAKWKALVGEIEKYEQGKPTFKFRADGSVNLSTVDADPPPLLGVQTPERVQAAAAFIASGVRPKS